MAADLHCHTTASDGTLTPAGLVQLAAERGLKAVGITDHDTVLGVAEATIAGEKFGVEIVPGVELNTDYAGTEVHMLGYYLDLNSQLLHEVIEKLITARSFRIKLIIEKLHAIGIQICEARVREIAGEGAVGRPHIAQALEEKGYVSNIKEAFERYIGQGGPAYVSRYKLSPVQGIEIIRQARGIPVLAHPGLTGKDDIIPELVAAGLAGIEIRHSKHTWEDEKRYSSIAREYALLMTGGSDYHGPKRKINAELGDFCVPLQMVESLKQRKRELG